jgi:hypothetical protein
MVRETEKYPWSSYRAYLGLETIPWLTTDWVLSQFSKRLSVARRAYMRFIQEGKGGGHQEEYHRGSDTDSRILGDDTFIGRVLDEKQMKQRQKVSLDKIMVEVCRYFSLKEKDLGGVGKDRRLSEVRGIAAWLVLELGVCTLGELGKRTGRDVSTLSSAVRRLQIRSKTDLKLAERMKELFETVS